MTNHYQQHFGLTHIPFAKNSPVMWQDAALPSLQNHFQQLLANPGIGVLTGEPGVGKTCALRHIVQSINPHQYQVFYLAETNFTPFDIYRQIAFNLGLTPAHRFAQLWRDIKQHIRECREHKRCLPAFLNFDFDAKDMMSVWFVGHPSLLNILDRVAYTALASRIQVRCQLQPVIERERFSAMLQFAFDKAGCQHTLLSDSGVELLRIASAGRPRIVNLILCAAMQIAASKNLNHLPDDILQQAILSFKN